MDTSKINEMVPITLTYRNENVWVDARKLHKVLCVGRDFTTWIKYRIEKYGFQENFDFVKQINLSSPKSGSSKARPQKITEYSLTIDMAKELAMVENNDSGREVRRYFIEVENKTRKLIAKIRSIGDIDDVLSLISQEGGTLYKTIQQNQKVLSQDWRYMVKQKDSIIKFLSRQVKKLEKQINLLAKSQMNKKNINIPAIAVHNICNEEYLTFSDLAEIAGTTVQRMQKLAIEEGWPFYSCPMDMDNTIRVPFSVVTDFLKLRRIKNPKGV